MCALQLTRRSDGPGTWFDKVREHLTDEAIEKIVVLPNGCWEWRGCVQRPRGYALIYCRKTRKVRMGHRLLWEIKNDKPFPKGRNGDHTCHNPKHCKLGDYCPHRRCINPDHCDPVTQAENLKRGEQQTRTHCPKGHEYTPDNTYYHKNRNSKTCRKCTLDASKSTNKAN